jgi:hypothetical protein
MKEREKARSPLAQGMQRTRRSPSVASLASIQRHNSSVEGGDDDVDIDDDNSSDADNASPDMLVSFAAVQVCVRARAHLDSACMMTSPSLFAPVTRVCAPSAVVGSHTSGTRAAHWSAAIDGASAAVGERLRGEAGD